MEETEKIYDEYIISLKNFFQVIPPLHGDNDILNKIIKLQANFITTNYDKTIEKI
ncbi:hypothetical protein VQE80_06515 [Staphylococcus shinii]|uniref:hypothetical protein n=1 Tax=Staphylococcus shinii TaxID=2912228 RepID=UPI001304B22D|nr:hypothetical protein [Staphylococcus shinii]